MSPRHTGFLSILRRWWALVALATGAGGLIAYVYGSRIDSTYEAESLLLVQPATVGGATAVETAQELMPTYAELVRSRRVLESTRKALGLSVTAEQLREDVRGEAGGRTLLLTIRVRSGDADQAAEIANTLAQKLRIVIARDELRPAAESRPASSQPLPTLRVVERAADVALIRPRVALSMEFGALAGFFVALAAIFFAEALGRTVRSEHDLAELAPFAFLGAVKGGRFSRNGSAIPLLTAPGRRGTDGYGDLVARLAGANDGQLPQAVLVSGIQGREGSGLVAAQLAAGLARPGTRVVLADFGGGGELMRILKRVRRLGGRAPAQRGKPLRRGSAVLDTFPLHAGIPLVLAVPRRPLQRALDLDEARAVLELLLEQAEAVVLHAAPPNSSPATLAWARLADVTVLVARCERTRRRNVVAALQGLEVVGANAVRTVLHTARYA